MIVGRGSCTCQPLDVFRRRLTPVPHDVKGEEQATQGIQVPEICNSTNCDRYQLVGALVRNEIKKQE